MDKKILIINSGRRENLFLDEMLAGLGNKAGRICLISPAPGKAADSGPAPDIRRIKWRFWPDISAPAPGVKNPLAQVAFALALPLNSAVFFCFLFYLRFYRRINLLICWQSAEKLIVTLPARLFGCRVVWCERPGPGEETDLVFLLRRLYLSLAGLARIVSFTSAGRQRLLGAGFAETRLSRLPFGLALDRTGSQQTIFESLAKSGRTESGRKFFTIGAWLDLRRPVSADLLFQSLARCHRLISRCQFIVIGDGPERKRLQWHARQLGIENIVWFVGDPRRGSRWFASFDVYAPAADGADYNDLHYALAAMSAGLPVLALARSGLEEFVKDGETGLVIEKNDPEDVARALKTLAENRSWCRTMGKNAARYIRENHDLNRTLDGLLDL